ncbi:MAG: hypothetical protein Ta2A_09810 [Treponemataceae bacterium]|nr:MAG: hypothetical protein Ta2A_09810 [Treponemataceae bacterium]
MEQAEHSGYEVTALRKRPQNFDQLAGQDFVAATIKNSIEKKQIAHAYLFSGPRGCGKTSSARILAKALNCEQGPTATPCGKCAACREITAGGSLDVIEIDGASNNGVDEVRQIKDEVLFPPNSLRYKIYIIDEVHMLTTGAFNALLKTIEEPPPYVIFIFATTETHKVPATIKSRCQQFIFRLVSFEKIVELLRSAAAELEIQADDEALLWVARESGGSVRDAYTLFDQIASFSAPNMTYEKIRGKLGIVSMDELNALLALCADGASGAALEKLDAIFAGGVSIEQFIQNMSEYLRSLLFVKCGITKNTLLVQAAERFPQTALDNWQTEAVERALSLVFELYRAVRYSISPRYETELAVANLCTLRDYVSKKDVMQSIENARLALFAGASSGAISSAAPVAVATAAPANPVMRNSETAAPVASPVGHIGGEITAEQIRRELLSAAQTDNSSFLIALEHSINWHLENDVLTVGINNKFSEAQLKNHKESIEKIIFDMCGKNISFTAEKIATSAETADAGAAGQQADERVQLLQRNFKGTIV